MKNKTVFFILLFVLISSIPLQAADEFEKGLRHYYRGELSKARENFKAAVEADTSQARPYFFLGNIHRKMGNIELARQTYDTALKRDTGYTTARERLAALLFEQEKWEEAAEQYRKLVKSKPRNFDYLYKIGVVNFKLRQLEEAREQFLRAREQRSRSARVHYYLGRLSLEEGDTLDAISRFERAIQLNPSEGKFYFYRGLAYFREEDYLRENDENWHSARDFQQAVKLEYDRPRTRFMLANSLLNRGLYSIRQEWTERGIERLRNSISQYRKVLATDWKASNAYHNMGVAYLVIGKLDLALDAVKEAIEIEPSTVFFHDTLGLIHYRRGEFDQALSAWDLVGELDSDYDKNPFAELLDLDSLSERIQEARIRR
ncbi:MAG: tetratricopeptide repeat protein [bacterium]